MAWERHRRSVNRQTGLKNERLKAGLWLLRVINIYSFHVDPNVWVNIHLRRRKREKKTDRKTAPCISSVFRFYSSSCIAISLHVSGGSILKTCVTNFNTRMHRKAVPRERAKEILQQTWIGVLFPNVPGSRVTVILARYRFKKIKFLKEHKRNGMTTKAQVNSQACSADAKTQKKRKKIYAAVHG